MNEDTSRDLNPLYQDRPESALLFGRGRRAGIDVREQQQQNEFYENLVAQRLAEQEKIRKKEKKERQRQRQQQAETTLKRTGKRRVKTTMTTSEATWSNCGRPLGPIKGCAARCFYSFIQVCASVRVGPGHRIIEINASLINALLCKWKMSVFLQSKVCVLQ